jgi:carboxyl-terminal processing protease
MKLYIKVVISAFILLILMATVFGTGVAAGASGYLSVPAIVRATNEPAQFNIFWQAWDIVHRHFVDRSALDPTQLTYGAIRGMLNALGDQGHTTFLTPDQLAQEQTDIAGKFSGIGAQLGAKDGLPVIVAPFDGSPAAQAGIKAGDVIVRVNGEDVTSLPLNQIVNRIRGPEGTQVTLTILRPDEGKSQDIMITRGEIDIPTATWALVPGTDIAVIRLSQFSANANDELVAALSEAKATGATGLIIDVRNNPGGLLDQAIKVTSQFLKDGNVLLEENAEGQRRAFPVEAGGVATEIPMVVLINRGTASAAEIFAGAIQDHQRGRLVGETTFGTGTVLQTFKLDDGSALLLGTSQWLTPNGRLIRKQGIEPDVPVELPLGTNLLSPGELKSLTVADLLKSQDTQLLKALELLNSLPQVNSN